MTTTLVWVTVKTFRKLVMADQLQSPKVRSTPKLLRFITEYRMNQNHKNIITPTLLHIFQFRVSNSDFLMRIYFVSESNQFYLIHKYIRFIRFVDVDRVTYSSFNPVFILIHLSNNF